VILRAVGVRRVLAAFAVVGGLLLTTAGSCDPAPVPAVPTVAPTAPTADSESEVNRGEDDEAPVGESRTDEGPEDDEAPVGESPVNESPVNEGPEDDEAPR
jgi:hypothetical protein